MNILYIHGFQGSGQSNSCQVLKNTLTTDNVFTPDIPTKPKDAIEFIDKFIKDNNIDIIIGTSLGGLYTKQFTIPKIIVNPAFVFPFKEGNYTFFTNRLDGKTNFDIDTDDILYIKELQSNCKYVVPEYTGLSHILIGTEDELIDFNSLSLGDYTNAYDNISYAKFGHRLTNDVIQYELLNLINTLKQQFKYIEQYNPINI